jgi:hypothetical protein
MFRLLCGSPNNHVSPSITIFPNFLFTFFPCFPSFYVISFVSYCSSLDLGLPLRHFPFICMLQNLCFLSHFIKYMLHKKIFKVKVVDLYGTSFLCYIPVLLNSPPLIAKFHQNSLSGFWKWKIWTKVPDIMVSYTNTQVYWVQAVTLCGIVGRY